MELNLTTQKNLDIISNWRGESTNGTLFMGVGLLQKFYGKPSFKENNKKSSS